MIMWIIRALVNEINYVNNLGLECLFFFCLGHFPPRKRLFPAQSFTCHGAEALPILGKRLCPSCSFFCPRAQPGASYVHPKAFLTKGFVQPGASCVYKQRLYSNWGIFCLTWSFSCLCEGFVQPPAYSAEFPPHLPHLLHNLFLIPPSLGAFAFFPPNIASFVQASGSSAHSGAFS